MYCRARLINGLPLISSAKPTAKISIDTRYAALAPSCTGIDRFKPSCMPNPISSRVMGPGLKVMVAQNIRKYRNEASVSCVAITVVQSSQFGHAV